MKICYFIMLVMLLFYKHLLYYCFRCMVHLIWNNFRLISSSISCPFDLELCYCFFLILCYWFFLQLCH
jgi:hypothetical protein